MLVLIAAIVLAACPLLPVIYDIVASNPFETHDAIYITYLAGPVLLVFLGMAARVAMRDAVPQARQEKTRLLGVRASWIFLIVISWMLASTLLFGPDKGAGIFKLGEICLMAAVGLAAADLTRASGPGGMTRLWWALCLSITVASVASVGLFVNAQHLYIDRVVPGFIHIRMFGFSLAASIAVMTAFFVHTYGRREKFVFYVAVLTILWAVLFWTASRGGVVALVLSVGIGVVVIPRIRQVFWPWLAAMFVGFVLSLPIPGHGHGGALSMFDHEANVDSLSSGRMTLWSNVVEVAMERPLTGHGYAQFRALMETHNPKLVPNAHTHNIILETLLAIGIPGTLVLAAAAITVWFRWLADVRQTPSTERLAAFLVISVLYAYSFVDAVYYFPQTLLFFAIAAGILGVRRPQAGSVSTKSG